MSNRHQIKDDKQFWTGLEYDACRWLQSSDDVIHKGFWVDGFLPEIAKNTRYGLDVEGVAWVGKGPREQLQYRFVVSVPQKILYKHREFSIGSFSLDPTQQTLQIELVREKSDKSSVHEACCLDVCRPHDRTA